MSLLLDMKVSLVQRANRKLVNEIETPSTEAGTIDNDVDFAEFGYQQWQWEILNIDSLIVDSSQSTLPNYDHKAPVWMASSLESVNDAGKIHNHKTKMPHNFDQTLDPQMEEIHLTPHAMELDGTEESQGMEGKVYHAFAVPSGWSSTFFPY